ncbi:nuclear transport factor 2 family protein [Streptomyces actinomycinicus]|uniref:Nuclear transport factor 2 family protein n=1 Tax=Streptomyces actinomycinicus TaxID=1695166 RepID=A0A937EI11_9ACTN|nr:nuclear transport factor 2 family protein [Streptomyces actinomycinicus]MBL1082531.1 nuclear transport factor 2 family protein [Streptomyces actinomycinicus]
MSRSPQEIFQSHVHAGILTRDADALAENFTEGGVLEAPLLPAGAALPQRMEGREEIRRAMAAYCERNARDTRAPNAQKSGYVLHTTADPDVFTVETDAVFDAAGDGDGTGTGTDETISLVQIFRVRDGKIARLRDYFAPRWGN